MAQALRFGNFALRQHLCRRFVTRGTTTPALAMATQGSKYHTLHYQYVPDILERRGPHREAHLAGAKKQSEAGKLLIAGAVGDPVDGALFIFKDTTKEDIEEFVRNDVYIKADLVTKWKIQPFTAVAGSEISKS